MEGALSTAYDAVDDFFQKRTATFVTPNKDRHIILDDRVLDIEKWAKVHPGGEKAIRTHLKDNDIHELFRHVGHSSNAWAIVFGLQVGFRER